MTVTSQPVLDPLDALSHDYVERGKTLVRSGESNAWDLGDYILEGFPMGDQSGGNKGIAQGIRRLASEISGEPESLTHYRKVAYSWPLGSRLPNATWAAHQAYMGHPSSAPARRQTLESLPRNEHGMITKQAVRNLTKGNTGGKPGWHELLGRVGDSLTDAVKHLDKIEAAIDRDPNEEFVAKAQGFADRADEIADRLRKIHEPPE